MTSFATQTTPPVSVIAYAIKTEPSVSKTAVAAKTAPPFFFCALTFYTDKVAISLTSVVLMFSRCKCLCLYILQTQGAVSPISSFILLLIILMTIIINF